MQAPKYAAGAEALGFVFYECAREDNIPASKFSLLLGKTRRFPGRVVRPPLCALAIVWLYSPEQV